MTAESNKQDALLAIERLVHYALEQGLIDWWDVEYSRNRLLELFGSDEPFIGEFAELEPLTGPQQPLEVLINYGFAIGLIPENSDTYRDLLDAKIMGLLTPRPSEVIASFRKTTSEKGIQAATDEFCKLSVNSNYIRMDRVANNIYWKQPTAYGDMEITINLSKPEKSPKEIAMAKLLPPPVYPKCQLCRENVGYAGRINHPARQNLRVIPLELNAEPWLFQYSPYVYYNEHCIVFHHDHVPMKLTRDTFKRLIDFTTQFPHYFIGSNADLPIVGGSILTHDHFQGGRHTFPLEKAPIEASFLHKQFEGITVSMVKWPMTVLRLNGHDPAVVLDAADDLYEKWKMYSDPDANVLAFTQENGESIPHNTVTPIMRRAADGGYEMDIVLRNNRCNDEHPEGIYHPHREMHHIKKENIGLIEVMGLAILPGRLKEELADIAGILSGDKALYEDVISNAGSHLAVHGDWIKELVDRFGTSLTTVDAEELLRGEVGLKFAEILGHAGVFKMDATGREAFRRFLRSVGYE
ncbi:UDPglucose--hexose-1-phosphate uridylyltransferase [Paenibacillus anaericanus]|uniref:UDP-glucose--hexose-1-phosphate uridylyltransferase n=1 Tax=Paenibacillus anaericanus TaxID=170367 RepID=UPI0027831140|nr:UDP-glucose--hexose-1-phosphate uridylyltransferase [Paenibacillus anaericanus]MDQ0090073.1 UDPglucose--hexose-1-phosphate uridylyltransferase [Paenibacillus anaericanus]